jgi:hypothetical protein
MKKTFVKVWVEFSVDGTKKPIKIFWSDSRIYEITKVISVKPRPSFKAGGIGERYEIKVNENITYLFFEEGKWFVEEK